MLRKLSLENIDKQLRRTLCALIGESRGKGLGDHTTMVCGIHLIEKTLSGEKYNHERCDRMELWENSTASLLLVPLIDIQGIFYSWRGFGVYLSVLFFPCHYDVYGVFESKQVFPLPRKPLARIYRGLCFSPDNVFSARCIHYQVMYRRVLKIVWIILLLCKSIRQKDQIPVYFHSE